MAKDSEGLLLLSMPTGFGKTHNVLDFIYKHFRTFAASGRRILFVTNLKKNLPHGELRKRFEADGVEDDYHRHVLFIDSNSDSAIKHLPSVDAQIPASFRTESYSRLKSYIETLKDGNKLPQAVKETLKAKIRKELEPGFRRFVTEYLLRKFKTKRERLATVRNNPDHQWIGRLYPSVFTDEKTVLFLSMDKFARKNSTLVEPSYYFHERLVENAVVFIDEFDSTKDTILKNIIESGMRHRVKLLDLFLNIHNHLMQNECPMGLLRESQRRTDLRKAKGFKWPALSEMVDSFREKADRIFKAYNLRHACKSHEEFSTNRNFLFYDFRFHHVLDAKDKRIEIIGDEENRANWIKAVAAGTKGPGINVRSLLSETTGFLTYFQRGIGYLADNYRWLKHEDNKAPEEFPLESAVRTVLNHFRLDTGDVEFFTKSIMEGEMPYGTYSQTRSFHRQGFYDSGFRYYDIVDSDEHDTLSKIHMYNFQRTPESFLAGICSRAMVVGISATAGLYTNIGNYDLEYMRSRLGERLIRLTGRSLEKLKADYSESVRGYERISIKTGFVGTDTQEETMDSLRGLLDDREAALALLNAVRSVNPNSDESEVCFIFARYVRALTVWRYFCEHPGILAFLCLFTKLPKSGDSKFDLDVFRRYTRMMQEGKNNSSDGAENCIIVLSGDNFIEAMAELRTDLGEGKRRFILSSYQTMGVGQNPEFPIPSAVTPIHVNEFEARKEMDIDAIYLDRPTNLLVNIHGKKIADEDFIKCLFQLEFLAENGAISPRTFKSKLDEAFHRYIDRIRPKRKAEDFISLYQTEAYTRFLNKVLVQAVGRICRTNMKSPEIHVLADAFVRKHLVRFSLPDDVIPVCEYTALRVAAGDATLPSTAIQEAQNRASFKSDRTAAYIRRQLKTPWTEHGVNTWRALRKRTLEHPAIQKKEMCEKDWIPCYVELPVPSLSYRYTQKWDYRETEIFFSRDEGMNEVSERSARLTELMAIEPFRRLFEKRGWATGFQQAELMLAPPIFNNIYKGALGEVCGEFVLKEVLTIDLHEMPLPQHEIFDFKYRENIFVDFKLWNDRIAIPAEDQIAKIRSKMESCNAERVFIINILGSSDAKFRPILSSDQRIVEVPYLCRNNRFDKTAMAFVRKEFCK